MKKIKNLSDIEIYLAPASASHNYDAEFVWDVEEGQTTWYKCKLFTSLDRHWEEQAEGGYVVASGWVDDIVIDKIENITYYRLIGDDEIEKTGSMLPLNAVAQMLVSELTEALEYRIENNMIDYNKN
jgi:hypothetical protein